MREADHFPRRAGCPDLPALDAAARNCAEPEIEQHVRTCEACRTLVTQLRDADGFLDTFRSGVGEEAPPQTADVPADLVPGYRIIGEVRRGAQGVVYKAVQERTKRTVAIKTLLAGTFATGKQRARFEREAEIAAGLKHPNIVTVYDSLALPGGRHAFVMEFIDGVPLDRWAPPPAPPAEERRRKLQMFAAVCAGVQHAHLSGVIHRDLKPSNVLVDITGVAHVLDFGIAKRSGPELTATLPGEFAGTPAYASPEQFSGRPEEIDSRTDVYSLGVMLYELLTGRMPYPIDGPVREIVDHVTRTEPAPPSAILPGIDRDLDTIVLRALEKDRARRYQSPGDLGNDLLHYLAGEAIQARRDSVWYVVSKAARRRKLPLAAALVALLALGAGTTALAVGLERARSARANERIAERGAKAEAARFEAVSRVLAELAISAEDSTRTQDPIGFAVDRLAGKIEAGMFDGRPEVEASIRALVAELYERRGMLDLAEHQRRLCVKSRRALLGSDDPDTARAEDELAILLASRGRAAEAASWADAASRAREHLPPSHPDRIRSIDTLARVKLAAGDATEAERLASRAAELRRTSLGANDPAVAESLLTLARARLVAGDAADALKIGGDALAVQFRSLPDGTPAMWEAFELLQQARLAASRPEPTGRYRRLADHAVLGAREAVPPALLRDLVVVKRDALGDESVEALRTHLYVGMLHVEACEYHDAEGTLTVVLRMLEHAYGNDAPLVGVCLSHLSTACAGMGHLDDALAHARRALAITRATLGGVDDRAVADATLAVADLQACLGKDQDSLGSYRDGITRLERTAGPDAPELALALARQALVELASGWNLPEQRERAAALAARAVEIASRTGHTRPEIVFASASARAAGGDLKGAAPDLWTSLEAVRPLFVQWSSHRRVARRLLETYQAAGDTPTRDLLVNVLEGIPASEVAPTAPAGD
jgi:tetratricopeptide (TPR) repeat protein/predicted Ser/Thr protein kinase